MSHNPLQIGITGGIGSGKSLICKIFKCLGIPVYDADSRAKWLMQYDPALKMAITQHFGELAYDNDILNRVYLSKVFEDPSKLSLLNNLVHPIVGDDYQHWISGNLKQPYLIKEAALLFESGSYLQLHKIIAVFAPLELRLKRVLNRDAYRTPEQIHAIMQHQMPEAIKESKADFVIHNDDQHLVIPQVLTLHGTFLELAKA